MMGWSEIKEGKKSLVIGDETLDLCDSFLRKFGSVYQESDLKRLPTIRELLKSIQLSLNVDGAQFVSDLSTAEVIDVIAKVGTVGRTKKTQVGDVISVPFGTMGYAFLHVLEAKTNGGVVGILPQVSKKNRPEISKQTSAYLAHSKLGRHLALQFTGVNWGIWKVVGHIDIADSIVIDRSRMTGSSPTVVAMNEILQVLKKAKLVAASYSWYWCPIATSPKLRDDYVIWLSECMKFFKTRKLVSKQALEVFEKNGVGQDFVLDSDVLSDRGNEFMKYINDFEGTSVGDVQENLQSYWKEFSGRRGG